MYCIFINEKQSKQYSNNLNILQQKNCTVRLNIKKTKIKTNVHMYVNRTDSKFQSSHTYYTYVQIIKEKQHRSFSYALYIHTYVDLNLFAYQFRVTFIYTTCIRIRKTCVDWQIDDLVEPYIHIKFYVSTHGHSICLLWFRTNEQTPWPRDYRRAS